MKEDKIKSYAKINLSLGVLKKFKNGFHQIESIVSFINYYDHIKIKRIKKKNHRVFFNGKFSKNIKKKNTVTNLLNHLDKLNLLKNHKYLIKIKKNIPQESGLGGGSVNASTLLNYFVKKNKINLNKKKIYKIASKIGSDVILGLEKKNSILLGNGKLIRSNSKIRLYVLIIKPNFGCSTKLIYKKIKIYSKPFLRKDSKVLSIKKLINLKNDLEVVTFQKYPALDKIKKTMQSLSNVIFVRMSGSGSSIVAYFNSKKASLIAAKILKKKYKNYWCILSKTI